MNPEDVLLWGALGTTLVAFVEVARALRGRPASPRLGRLLAASAALLSIATGLMLLYFLLVRLDIEYVFTYTSRSTPWYYRVAGLWAGQKGTLLIWSAASAAIVWWTHRVWTRKVAANEAPDSGGMEASLRWVLAFALPVVALFEALLLRAGTFDATDPYLRTFVRPEGVGLQPVLRTPFMIIHPPLQFLGYSVSTLLFAAGLAGVVGRRREWADIALPWARLGFLIATVGLGLGGLWAYYVLNFGGYWAWDPVETANLLAWFPLLLSVHALRYYRKRGMFAASAPIFAVLALLMDLFATIATRTGLWISVHAFTDPSRNFSLDPLERLLNILETSVILSWLAGMFIACVLAVVAAYAYRLAVDARPDARLSGWAWRGAAAVLSGLVVLALAAPRFTLSAVFQAADAIAFDRAPIGLGILVFAAALVVASPRIGPEPEPAAKARWRDWRTQITTPKLVFLGMVLISLAFLVTFLLLLLSVNGYERAVYDERAPLVALPILLVLPVGLAHALIGAKRALWISGGALALGVLLAWRFPQQWGLLLVAPALAWALVGTAWKQFSVSDLGAAGDRRLRVAALLLQIGGAVGMVFWANPPTRIGLGFTTVFPEWWWGFLGFPLALAGTLSSVGVNRAKTIRAHRYGAALLILSWGFGVSALLGVVALALAESRRSRFPDAGSPTPIVACAVSLKREIRKCGVYLMHVAIVLGLAGYALSTYDARPLEEIAVRQGEPAEAHGYEFELVGSAGRNFDSERGVYFDVDALVRVTKAGRDVGVHPLTMSWAVERMYGERIQVLRLATEDVYLRPVEFVTPERTFLSREENVMLTSGTVDEVTFTVSTLPGMHLVWGGLWMIAAGMLVNLAAGAGRWEASRPKAGAE